MINRITFAFVMMEWKSMVNHPFVICFLITKTIGIEVLCQKNSDIIAALNDMFLENWKEFILPKTTDVPSFHDMFQEN